MKTPNRYLEVILMLAFVLGAYVLAAYLDQQDIPQEQHQPKEPK